MKESMRAGVTALLVIMVLGVECRAQHPVASGFGVEMRVIGTFGASTGPVDVTNIPLALRTVPSNEHGPLTTGTPVTITPSTISLPGSSAGISIGLAPQYAVSRFTFRAGAMVSFLNLSSRPPSVDSQAVVAAFPEINQSGTNQRGVGTSLVYYDVYWSRATPAIVPFGELEFRLTHFASLVGGYSGQQRSTANIQTGYDQYDALSKFNDKKLASITSDGFPYGGLKIALIGPYVGLLIGAAPVNWERSSSAYPITTGFNGKRGVQIMFGMDVGWTRSKNR